MAGIGHLRICFKCPPRSISTNRRAAEACFRLLKTGHINKGTVMKLNFIRQSAWAAALVLCCAALASVPAAHAEDKMTAHSLIDRQLILNQITRYYYNFGKTERQSE